MEIRPNPRKFGCDVKTTYSFVPSVGGRAPREVSRKLLSEFLEPRVEEILTLVRDQLAEAGYLSRIPSGVVVTGGSSALDGLPELAEEIFELPVRLGIPRGVGGLADRVQGPEFATGVGLVIWGSRRRAKPRFRIYGGPSFGRVRARMREWLYGNQLS